MAKPIDLQYSYKKQISFTKQQKEAFKTLELYGVNVNQFIRSAVKEKLKKDWKNIKETKNKSKCPF
jgi:cobalamin biosynthesis protein CbiD